MGRCERMGRAEHVRRRSKEVAFSDESTNFALTPHTQASFLLVVVYFPGHPYVHRIPFSRFHCFRFRRLSQLFWCKCRNMSRRCERRRGSEGRVHESRRVSRVSCEADALPVEWRFDGCPLWNILEYWRGEQCRWRRRDYWSGMLVNVGMLMLMVVHLGPDIRSAILAC